jgi:hypothetical protein
MARATNKDPRFGIDDAYHYVVTALDQMQAAKAHSEAIAHLHSAMFQLSMAKLWLTCPEETANAVVIGRKKPVQALVENAPPAAPPTVQSPAIKRVS